MTPWRGFASGATAPGTRPEHACAWQICVVWKAAVTSRNPDSRVSGHVMKTSGSTLRLTILPRNAGALSILDSSLRGGLRGVRCALVMSLALILPALVAGQPVGSVHRDRIDILAYDSNSIARSVPLPPGDWQVIASAQSQNRSSNFQTLSFRTVALAHVVNRRLAAAIEIRSQANQTQVRWNDELCKDDAVIYKNGFGTSLWKQRCLTIFPSKFLQGDNTVISQAISSLQGVEFERNAVAVQYIQYEDGSYLGYKILVFPSHYGLENPLVSDLRVSPYAPAKMGSPKNQEFRKALVDYGEEVSLLLDEAFRRTSLRPLPELSYGTGMNNAASKDGADSDAGISAPERRLTELKRLFDAGLLTPAEYAAKRKTIIEGL